MESNAAITSFYKRNLQETTLTDLRKCDGWKGRRRWFTAQCHTYKTTYTHKTGHSLQGHIHINMKHMRIRGRNQKWGRSITKKNNNKKIMMCYELRCDYHNSCRMTHTYMIQIYAHTYAHMHTHSHTLKAGRKQGFSFSCPWWRHKGIKTLTIWLAVFNIFNIIKWLRRCS